MTRAEPMTLAEAAERLDVHYMTAYRYVRIGRLPAHKLGGQWRVETRDVEALLATPPATKNAPRDPNAGPGDLADRLVAGDEPGAWRIVENRIAIAASPAEVYLEMLAPAMAIVGARWASGDYDVADEHRATATATRVVGRLGPSFRRRGQARGTVLIGAAPGDRHALPVAMAADLIRLANFDAIDLGADLPRSSWVSEAARIEPGTLTATVLSVATAPEGDTLREVIESVAITTGRPVGVGGPGAPNDLPNDDRIHRIQALGDLTGWLDHVWLTTTKEHTLP